MKSFLLGLLGAVVGFALCFFLVKGAGGSVDTNNDKKDGIGVSYFDEPGSAMALKSFKVFQVTADGYALAESSEKAQVQWSIEYGEPLVLLVPEGGSSFYDEQIIKVPQGKVVRQVGIFRYKTKTDDIKTVPVVRFLNK